MTTLTIRTLDPYQIGIAEYEVDGETVETRFHLGWGDTEDDWEATTATELADQGVTVVSEWVESEGWLTATVEVESL